jgi:hypothetical protein
LSVKVTPVGGVPIKLKLGVGSPLAVTLNVPAQPTVKRAELALVIWGAEPTPIDSCAVALAGGDSASVTSTVKFEMPTVVGVPEMVPVPGSNDSPGGSDPWEMDHE